MAPEERERRRHAIEIYRFVQKEAKTKPNYAYFLRKIDEYVAKGMDLNTAVRKGWAAAKMWEARKKEMEAMKRGDYKAVEHWRRVRGHALSFTQRGRELGFWEGPGRKLSTMIKYAKIEEAPPGGYSCPRCGRVFSSAEELNKHIEEKHKPPKRKRCPRCGAAIPPIAEICAQCGYRFVPAYPAAVASYLKRNLPFLLLAFIAIEALLGFWPICMLWGGCFIFGFGFMNSIIYAALFMLLWFFAILVSGWEPYKRSLGIGCGLFIAVFYVAFVAPMYMGYVAPHVPVAEYEFGKRISKAWKWLTITSPLASWISGTAAYWDFQAYKAQFEAIYESPSKYYTPPKTAFSIQNLEVVPSLVRFERETFRVSLRLLNEGSVSLYNVALRIKTHGDCLGFVNFETADPEDCEKYYQTILPKRSDTFVCAKINISQPAGEVATLSCPVIAEVKASYHTTSRLPVELIDSEFADALLDAGKITQSEVRATTSAGGAKLSIDAGLQPIWNTTEKLALSITLAMGGEQEIDAITGVILFVPTIFGSCLEEDFLCVSEYTLDLYQDCLDACEAEHSKCTNDCEATYQCWRFLEAGNIPGYELCEKRRAKCLEECDEDLGYCKSSCEVVKAREGMIRQVMKLGYNLCVVTSEVREYGLYYCTLDMSKASNIGRVNRKTYLFRADAFYILKGESHTSVNARV
jgi:ribosomal protein L40E